MTSSHRQLAASLFIVAVSCAAPVFAQNAAPNAAPAAAPAGLGYGTTNAAPTGADRQAARLKKEQSLLGAPREYGSPDAQGDGADAQQAALLNEQRMTVTGGGQGGGAAAPAKGARNAKAGGAPKAGDNLMAAGAAKSTYADPYDTTGAGKRAVYRSPW
ncbi:hypothetical protein P3T18_001545 [Paraburkholderia sp. GAS199]|uniref:hypothetical protein n=1 Tax=Paraburkholderia sp. GAS199 TaxID=3035126 RepID=UPI003D1D0BA5